MGAPGALRGLGLSVDEVVHHGDVDVGALIRPEGVVAVLDPHAGDDRLGEEHAEEREPARLGGDGERPEQPPVDVVVAKAGLLRDVDVGVDRAEAADHGGALGSQGGGRVRRRSRR